MIALLDNISTPTLDVLLVLDHVKPAHLPPNACLVPPLDMFLTLLAFVLLNVVMDSFWAMRDVILATLLQLDARIVKFRVDGPAQDSLQCADPTL